MKSNKSIVYFTKKITPESLIKMYEKLGVKLKDKVGVKISTGEKGGHNFLDPKLIQPLVKKLNGTIIECCTAYPGSRNEPKVHWQTIKEHGFKDIAPCDIMDEEGEFEIPVKKGGVHLKVDIVGTHLKNYKSILMLSHFKGHQMAGMGGALKNMSIGVGSANGKCYIHSAAKIRSPDKLWTNLAKQDDFLESMADACNAVMSFVGKQNIVYINVANKISIDCDCDSHPKDPEMKDIGIYASLDPVAIDQACYDAIINSTDPGKKSLIDRMNKQHAIHIVEQAEKEGLGSRQYTIVNVD